MRLLRLWLLLLWHTEVEHTILEVGLDLIERGIFRKSESSLKRLLSSLPAMPGALVLLLFLTVLSLEHKHVLVEVHTDVVLVETWHVHVQADFLVILFDVDSREPFALLASNWIVQIGEWIERGEDVVHK